MTKDVWRKKNIVYKNMWNVLKFHFFLPNFVGQVVLFSVLYIVPGNQKKDYVG